MAGKTQLAQRLDTFLKHQLEMLEVECGTMKDAMDDIVSKMRLSVAQELDQWNRSGHVDQLRFQELSKNIQQATTFVIMKTMELYCLNNDETEWEVNTMSESQTTDSIMPPTARTTATALGISVDFESMIRRLAKLEEDVFSLKNATKEIQEKQEICDEKLKEPSVPKKHFDKLLNDVKILKKNANRFQKELSGQHENVDKKVDTLHNMHLKFKKKIQERVNEIKETNGDFSSNVDHCLETVTKVDSRLKCLEDENKSVNVSMNELNKKISSVKTCNNEALMSIQNLSKSVESTNQHYNEMSNKMNQLEISIKRMAAQYTEQLENMKSHNQDKFEDLIGVVCQLVAKRLTPMEDLKKALHTVSTTKTPLTLKMEDTKRRYVHLSDRLSKIESKRCLPDVGFYASGYFDLNVGDYIFKKFRGVQGTYKGNFGEQSGIFTVPFTGLYLISISAELAKNNSIEVEYYCEDPNELCPVPWVDNRIKKRLCRLTGNQPVTVCCDLRAQGEVLLFMKIREKNGTFIDFSCVLINEGNEGRDCNQICTI